MGTADFIRRASGLYAPTGLGVGSWKFLPCGGCCGPSCAYCSGGTAPAEWSALLGNFGGSGFCTNCPAELNKTHILTTDISGCGAGRQLSFTCSGGGTVFINIAFSLGFSGGLWHASLIVYEFMAGINIAEFKQSYGTAPDCPSFSDALPLIAGNALVCSGIGATCTVSAV